MYRKDLLGEDMVYEALSQSDRGVSLKRTPWSNMYPPPVSRSMYPLSPIQISEPTRPGRTSDAVCCLKKKKHANRNVCGEHSLY